jgi:hypothetical protein
MFQELIILMETACSIDPILVKDMQKSTDKADRLGLTGCSLFKCDNYTSGIHWDKERTKNNLCSSLMRQAKPREYVFAQLKYRVVIETESNSLW